jgi:hypothetical protein
MIIVLVVIVAVVSEAMDTNVAEEHASHVYAFPVPERHAIVDKNPP